MRLIVELEVLHAGEDAAGSGTLARIKEPQYETEEYYAVTAFATDLDEAARKATRYMLDYLTEEKGLSREDAYMLASVAGDLKISEVVDMPHMLVSMHIPKSIFIER